MDSVSFGGQTFRAQDLQRALEDAAHNRPPTDYKPHVQDGRTWASTLLDTLKGGPLWPAVGAALDKMIAKGDAEERALALELEMSHRALAAEDLYAHLKALGPGGDGQAVWSLLSSLSARADAPYRPMLRDFLTTTKLKKAILPALLRHDLDWVAAHVDDVFPRDRDELLSLLANGLSGLSRRSIGAVDVALTAAMAGWGEGEKEGLALGLESGRQRARA